MVMIQNYVLIEGKSLGLKVVYRDGRPESWKAPEAFRWNLELGGETEAQDWNPASKAGGLHVWEWGQGELYTSCNWYEPNVVWLVVEYETSSAVRLDGCVKVPRCKTICVSADRKESIAFIQKHTPPEKQGKPLFEVVEAKTGYVKVGDGGIATVQERFGFAKAGHNGIARAPGRAEAGDMGYAEAGDDGSAVVGDSGLAQAGCFGSARAGWCGTAIVGDDGFAQAGPEGRAEAGANGVAIAEAFGSVKAGSGGKVKVGEGGILQIEDVKFRVGENGIKPNTFYKLDDSGIPVEVEG